ncbi:MAG: GNAT family N-acetyltransferase [Candidatus Woesearchaeota archaeon]
MARIRLAEIKDCGECAELSRIKELRPAGSDFISGEYFSVFVDKDGMFLVAEDKGRVIGFILGEPMKGGLAHLGLLTVDESFRGQGIGRMLLDAFRKKCDEKGLKDILLYAPKSNRNTLEFYKKRGFKEGREHIQFLETRE